VSSDIKGGYKEMAQVKLVILQYILISALFHPQKSRDYHQYKQKWQGDGRGVWKYELMQIRYLNL